MKKKKTKTPAAELRGRTAARRAGNPVRIRRRWTIHPAGRVKKSALLYMRARRKAEDRRKLSEESE